MPKIKFICGLENISLPADVLWGSYERRLRKYQFIPFFGFGSVRGSQKKRKECHFTFYLNTYKNVARKMAGGYVTKFYAERLRPEVQYLTPEPFNMTIFDRKAATFVYLLMANDTPFTY